MRRNNNKDQVKKVVIDGWLVLLTITIIAAAITLIAFVASGNIV